MWHQDELCLALSLNTFSILVKASSMRTIRKSSTASKILDDITNSPSLNNPNQHQHVLGIFCCSLGEGGIQLQGMEVACSVGLTLAQHVRAQVLHAGDQDEDRGWFANQHQSSFSPVSHPAKLLPPSRLSCKQRGNFPIRLTLTQTCTVSNQPDHHPAHLDLLDSQPTWLPSEQPHLVRKLMCLQLFLSGPTLFANKYFYNSF